MSGTIPLCVPRCASAGAVFGVGCWVDREDSTTAAREAMRRRNPEILKVLRLKPNAAQALALLSDAAICRPNVDVFRNLIAIIPREQINDTTRDSSP